MPVYIYNLEGKGRGHDEDAWTFIEAFSTLAKVEANMLEWDEDDEIRYTKVLLK